MYYSEDSQNIKKKWMIIMISEMFGIERGLICSWLVTKSSKSNEPFTHKNRIM